MTSNHVLYRRWFAAFLIIFAILFLKEQRRAEAQAIQPAADLQPKDRAVIARLEELNHLPQGAWRVHAGDVAHGEEANLDDSSWPTAQPNSDYPDDAIWFRQWIQVPATLHGYDLTGSRIWFQLIAHAHGTTPEIIYLNGRRVAMGDDLEPVMLFDQAQPGDKVLVAVKLLPTVGEKHFTSAEMRVEFSAGRPNPDNLREEFLAAAELMPSGPDDPPADRATLCSAIGEVDLKALDTANQRAFDASLLAAQSRLEALRPSFSRQPFLRPATPTSTPPGFGRGPKPLMWSSVRFRLRCN